MSRTSNAVAATYDIPEDAEVGFFPPFAISPPQNDEARRAGFGSRWTCIGKDEQFLEGRSYVVSTSTDGWFLITRHADRTIHAISATHDFDGRSLMFHSAAECKSFRCPLHGWAGDFSSNLQRAREMDVGEAVATWRTLSKKVFPVRCWNGLVFACTEADEA